MAATPLSTTPGGGRMNRTLSYDSPETLILRKQKTESELRSLTITDRTSSVSNTPDGHRYHGGGRTSPLKRFGQAKESIHRAFGLIKTQLHQVQEVLLESKGSEGEGRIERLLDKTKGIEDMLARDHMKVAFFGRTSNGKSTVVNALLRDKILPAGIGHTTNCFLSVVGINEETGYVMKPESEERCDVKSLQQLANSLHKESLSTNSFLRVYWPKEKCALLQEDVEFVDSPGIDMNPDVDDWINSHCLDADVFVLVSNAESTLMNAEKNFFHRVSERLSRPNIFILNNRWDVCVEEEPGMVEEVRQQHLENDIAFLSNQLQITDQATAKERVYFVSAKEVLTIRMRQKNSVDNQNHGRGLSEGYNGRLLEFERFESKFKECLSNSAIKTKFEQHHLRGAEIVSQLEELLKTEEEETVERSTEVQSNLQSTCTQLQFLNERGHSVYRIAQEKALSLASDVETRVQSSMEGILNHIATITDEYKPQESFDHTRTESYKTSLYNHIDTHLEQELSHLCPATLGSIHNTACTSIIADYQQLLGLSGEEANTYSLGPPEVSRVIRCSELCKGFREDLEFRFSLGIFSITKWINTGSLMFALQRQVSHMTTIIPAELLLPITLLGGGMILSRLLSWRYLLPPTLLYVGVYMYEHLTWTDRAKEQRLKKQVVSYLNSKFDSEIKAVKLSYKDVLLTDLHRLLDRLNSTVNLAQQDHETTINKLSGEEEKLGHLQGKIRTLRNSVQLLKRDLDDFKEEYLGVD